MARVKQSSTTPWLGYYRRGTECGVRRLLLLEGLGLVYPQPCAVADVLITVDYASGGGRVVVWVDG